MSAGLPEFYHQGSQRLIEAYELELCAPPCLPGAPSWSGRIALDRDIEAVLPYLNTRLEGAEYDQEAKILIWKDRGYHFAFRCREIKAGPAQDREEALNLIERAVSLVNTTWQERETLEPSYENRAAPNLMQIYRLLPHTNCGECGCATCMAFAAQLRQDGGALTRCPVLHQPGYETSRVQLLAML